MKANNSFKPKLLRYGNGVAEKACHAVACATQFGLTQVLATQGEIIVKAKIALLSTLAITGCTSINVRPVDNVASIQNVCIVRNPKVIVSDFIPVLQDGFNRHNVSTTVVEQDQASSCDVTLTYTALRSWDFKPYISHAELRLWRSGRQIGSADYHLKGKGGFALTKWGSTKEKMDPVIDQLLTGKAGG